VKIFYVCSMSSAIILVNLIVDVDMAIDKEVERLCTGDLVLHCVQVEVF